MRGERAEAHGARREMRGAALRGVLLAATTTVIAGMAPMQPDYSLTAVPASQVTLTDRFWAPKLETNRRVTIPHIMRENETTGRVDNFRKAARQMPGAYTGRRFNDTDVYKVIEAASLSLNAHPDPALDRRVDDLIALIAAAQEPDGYLFPARTIDPGHPAPGVGPERWVYENGSHELYNCGHLYEAAAAHFLATGKRTLLDVAIRNADLVAATFGPNGRHAVPGHEVVEVGLVKLFRITGNRRYLDTAKFFVDQRGRPHPDMQDYPAGPFAMYNERSYKQDQAPFVEQMRAVGHAVRAVYLYMGAADVAALTGAPGYQVALDRLWDDMTSKRMYLTGGIGARGTTESFGEDYELPNQRAYTETCAAVGNVLWGHRMFLLHGDAKYLDVLEQVLYNGYLSGVSLSGDRFFYQNPLESTGRTARSEYFDVACCPANLARLMEQIPGLLYSTRGSDIFVNLYAANTATVRTTRGEVGIQEQTEYPWQGRVTLTLDVAAPRAFALELRIPSWANGQSVPGHLYRFTSDVAAAVGLSVNGRAVPLRTSAGFAVIERTWRKGDTVQLDLGMQPRAVTSGDRIADNLGKVAIQRGPIVYAFEAVDNGGAVLGSSIATHGLADERRPDLLGGVTVIRASGLDAAGHARTLTGVPYYAWANRGPGEMAVWLKQAPAEARPSRTLALTFDDLPKAPDAGNLDATRATTRAILAALSRHRAPAVAFVNERKLYDGETLVPERVAVLESWIAAGVPIGNHTFSHADVDQAGLEAYEQDVARGESIWPRLMREHGLTAKWFRHPYTHTGKTADTKGGLQHYLDARGYRVAPFTIENSDWLFSSAYTAAQRAHDEHAASRLADAYLAYSGTMLGWFESLAQEDFGRAIPQILLIHANDLNETTLDALLTRIEARGYRYVTLEQAMADAAYRTPDDYVGPGGLSWLHRWRVAMHLPPRMADEPDPPRWVLDAAAAARSR